MLVVFDHTHLKYFAAIRSLMAEPTAEKLTQFRSLLLANNDQQTVIKKYFLAQWWQKYPLNAWHTDESTLKDRPLLVLALELMLNFSDGSHNGEDTILFLESRIPSNKNSASKSELIDYSFQANRDGKLFQTLKEAFVKQTETAYADYALPVAIYILKTSGGEENKATAKARQFLKHHLTTQSDDNAATAIVHNLLHLHAPGYFAKTLIDGMQHQDTAKEKDDEIAQLKQEVAGLKIAHEKPAVSNQHTQTATAAQPDNSQAKAYEKSINALQAVNAQLQKRNQELTKQVQDQKDAKQDAKKAAQDVLNQHKKDHTQALGQLNKIIAALSSEIDENKRTNKALKEKIASLQSQAKPVAINGDSASQGTSLTQKENDKLQKNVTALKNQLKAQQASHTKLAGQITAYASMHEITERQLHDKEKELKHSAYEVSVLEGTIRTLTDTIQDLRAKIATLTPEAPQQAVPPAPAPLAIEMTEIPKSTAGNQDTTRNPIIEWIKQNTMRMNHYVNHDMASAIHILSAEIATDLPVKEMKGKKAIELLTQEDNLPVFNAFVVIAKTWMQNKEAKPIEKIFLNKFLDHVPGSDKLTQVVNYTGDTKSVWAPQSIAQLGAQAIAPEKAKTLSKNILDHIKTRVGIINAIMTSRKKNNAQKQQFFAGMYKEIIKDQNLQNLSGDEIERLITTLDANISNNYINNITNKDKADTCARNFTKYLNENKSCLNDLLSSQPNGQPSPANRK